MTDDPKKMPCLDVVGMATTQSLIDELKTRFLSGALIIYNPTPLTEKMKNEWLENIQEAGYLFEPEYYKAMDSVWGNHHTALGLVNRLVHKINERLDEEESDLEEEEIF